MVGVDGLCVFFFLLTSLCFDCGQFAITIKSIVYSLVFSLCCILVTVVAKLSIIREKT